MKHFIRILILVIAVLIVTPVITNYYRNVRPRSIIERLRAPVEVTGWNSSGLIAADGRIIPIPGITNLPATSPALSEVIQHGVEIDGSKKIFALVRVHHWCGNDPVRHHVARVDLTDMLTFLRGGDPANTSALESVDPAFMSHGEFSQWGWNVSEYSWFNKWQKSLPQK